MGVEKTYSQVLDDFAVRVSAASYDIAEKRVRLLLQPKPRWVPTGLWGAVIRRTLLIEERGNKGAGRDAEAVREVGNMGHVYVCDCGCGRRLRLLSEPDADGKAAVYVGRGLA